jgi:hypothetical protein
MAGETVMMLVGEEPRELLLVDENKCDSVARALRYAH